MTKRKFYKTTLLVEVLSEDKPVDDTFDLGVINHLITDGDCSGNVSIQEAVELSPKEAAQALVNQHSDPEFFNLDSEGNEVGL